MLVVGVKADIDAALARLESLRSDQAPFAVALALTRTAQYAKGQLKGTMAQVFDRPTPYTMNSLFVNPATKTSFSARVRIKDEAFKGGAATNWLLPEIEGGARRAKGFEMLLQRNGILPSGYFAVPTSYAPLDAYGNVPASVYQKLLSQLQSARDPQQNESAASRARRLRRSRADNYFAVKVGDRSHLKPGIYQRQEGGGRIAPLFMFTANAPKYSKRFDFYGLGMSVAKERFPEELEKAMDYAIRTAR